MSVKLRSLYRRGDLVKNAFFVANGPVYIGLENKPVALEFPGGVVGTLEHFLQDLKPRNEKRLFDLLVPAEVQVSAMPFKTLDTMALEYEFGFNSNVFLSRCLEFVTDHYVTRSRDFSEELRTYQLRSTHFCNLVNDVESIAERLNYSRLRDFVSGCREMDIYRDGSIMARYHRLHAISVTPNPLSEYVQQYQKNAAICREGSIATEMYVLLSGRVGVTRGDRYVDPITEPGEAFGEQALFLDGRRTAALSAEENTRLYVLKKDDLPHFHSTHQDVFTNIACTLAKRIHDTVERTMRLSQLLKSNHQTEDGRSIEEKSWREVQQLHNILKEAQERKPSDALEKLLAKHAVF